MAKAHHASAGLAVVIQDYVPVESCAKLGMSRTQEMLQSILQNRRPAARGS